jgi:hypothetical protein
VGRLQRLMWWPIHAAGEPEGWRRYAGNALSVVVLLAGCALGLALLVAGSVLTVAVLRALF